MRAQDTVPKEVVLVLGGARSGKSRYAEGLVEAMPAPWAYVATAEALDAEMAERIAHHRAARPAGWHTLDAPRRLPQALRELPPAQPVLVDCLTLWLTNHFLVDDDLSALTADLLGALEGRAGLTVLVSNEVGLGIVPDNALARRFRDAAGRLNQAVAARADRVVFMVAGLPMAVKGSA